MANDRIERKLVNKFIEKQQGGTFHKSFMVGNSLLPKDTKDWLEKFGQAEITAKKIDLIWYQSKDTRWILEAKMRMDMKALGQLLCYRHLYLLENYPVSREIKLGLICIYSDPMLEPVFEEYNIFVFKI